MHDDERTRAAEPEPRPTRPPILYGFHYSVYTRVARLVLAEKDVDHAFIDVNPFDPELDEEVLALHPFRRVPVLEHEGRRLYETAALAQYVDEAFEGPALQPGSAAGRARMRQVVAVVDAYGYWPLVRQVYNHRVFVPAMGGMGDEREVAEGLSASRRVLAALEDLAGLDGVLARDRVTLADLHLAPMIDGLAQAPEGEALLASFSAISRWWGWIRHRRAFTATDPGPLRAGYGGGR